MTRCIVALASYSELGLGKPGGQCGAMVPLSDRAVLGQHRRACTNHATHIHEEVSADFDPFDPSEYIDDANTVTWFTWRCEEHATLMDDLELERPIDYEGDF